MLKNGDVTATFDPLTGKLVSFRRGEKVSSLTNGPRVVYCFAGVREARFETAAGALTVAGEGTYLRIGTPRISHPFTTVPFPAGDLSFLAVIPAAGSKFITPENTGPASQPVNVSGRQSGSVVFGFHHSP